MTDHDPIDSEIDAQGAPSTASPSEGVDALNAPSARRPRSFRIKTSALLNKHSIRVQHDLSKTSPMGSAAKAAHAPNRLKGEKSEVHDEQVALHARLEMKDLKGLIGFQLRQASFLFSHLYAEHLQTLGLSPLEFSILEVVNMNAGVTAQQVCNVLNLRAPNAVKLIQVLSEQDLIARQPHPHDRRAFGIVLTAKGQALTTRALEHLSQMEKIGLKGLNERQKTALLKQLELINSSPKKPNAKS